MEIYALGVIATALTFIVNTMLNPPLGSENASRNAETATIMIAISWVGFALIVLVELYFMLKGSPKRRH